MLGLLSACLIVAVVLLPAATLGLFTVRAARVAGAQATALPTVSAVLVVGLAGLAVGAVAGLGPMRSAVAALVVADSVLAWAPFARPWAIRGLVCWALCVDAGVLYLGYVLVWTLSARLAAGSMAASLALLALEVFVFLIGLGYLWEFVDVLARRHWTAYLDPKALPAPRLGARPFVSLHVPTHNEPPDMVIATLEGLLQLDYDDYEILLVDNNTTDPALWRPVEEFCAGHERITFLHLEDWPGYKSGALNHALTVTDPRAEVIGIVDADYLVEPDFLADCAPLFADPGLSFVQTPQDYRSWDISPYFRRLYYSYGYFFDVSQTSRNERNGAIFGGTMGLIRRSALESAGGWDEWCITEDAELSLRLLKAGGHGIHIDRSYGYGVMPLTFEALKRQRFRWCFGGVQILRLHWRDLLPGRRTDRNQLTLAQRWAYFVGGLQWFGDLASVWFTGFLVLGAISAAQGDGVVVRRLSGVLLFSVVVLVVLGALRALAMLRRTSGARWGEALGAFGIWLALGWTVARASTLGLVARQGVFLRTPKVKGEPTIRDALRGNVGELVLAAGCAGFATLALIGATAGATLVGVLLLVQGLGYLAAPLNSVAAIRSDLPEPLRRRRREMVASWGRPVRRGGFVFAGAAAVLVGLVVFAAPVGTPDLTKLPDVANPEPGETPSPAGTSTGTPLAEATLPGGSGSAVLPGSVGASAALPGQATATGSATAGPGTASGGPTQATHPTQATQPTQANQPTHPTQATQPTHPTQATAPTHPTQATQPPAPAPSSPTTRPSPTRKPTTTPSRRPSTQP